MTKKLLFASMLIAAVLLPLIGQEAKIMILERSDTATLKTAYTEYKAALKHWEDAKQAVAKKYTLDEKGKVMEGWERVEFSVDFRAVVPEKRFYSWNGYGHPVPSYNIVPSIGISGTLLSATGTTDLATSAVLSTGVDAVSAEGVRSDLKTREK